MNRLASKTAFVTGGGVGLDQACVVHRVVEGVKDCMFLQKSGVISWASS
jgi:hypothetical protein